MLASISKIKSFRETGEFDLSQNSQHSMSLEVPQAAANHSGERVPQGFPPTNDRSHCNRTSDQVLLAEPTLDATREPEKSFRESQQPGRRHEGYGEYSHPGQPQAQDHFSNLSSIQNYHSRQSTKTTIGNQLHLINE